MVRPTAEGVAALSDSIMPPADASANSNTIRDGTSLLRLSSYDAEEPSITFKDARNVRN
ncbi:MAG: hypothetical protein WBO09_10895 [Methylocystis silviterrae]|uniref:hypothetical protein n=1 Tax=Methylocystis silviterrae TaxID=2743612 RepID=UPI003C76886C